MIIFWVGVESAPVRKIKMAEAPVPADYTIGNNALLRRIKLVYCTVVMLFDFSANLSFTFCAPPRS